MPWFRLDDSFHSHPKVIAAGNEAVGLYVRCGTYAAQHLTNGFIPEDIAVLYGASDTGSRRNPGTGKPETLAETLIATKLWRRARRGYRMPDYLDYNPSKQAVEKERKNAAERQKRRREALLSQRDTPVTHTTPTRPDPTYRSVVEVGEQTDDRNARTRELEGLTASLTEAKTGEPLTPPQAARLTAAILAGRNPSNPGAYIRSVIAAYPDPVTRFLTPARSNGPPPPRDICGRCGDQGHNRKDCTR